MMKNSIYTIRLARKDEYESLRAFLKSYWGENHVLVKNKVIFDFQYLQGNEYNVVIAINNQTNEIDLFWGLITTSKYDESLKPSGDCWGAVVKVRNDVKNNEIGGLAFRTLRWILKQPQFMHFNHSGMGSMGKAFLVPYCTVSGPLKQYYIANKETNEFRIATKPLIDDYEDNKSVKVNRIDLQDVKTLPHSTYKPFKTLSYVVNRYLHHPFYRYFAWMITQECEEKSLWILRKIEVQNLGSVLRVVDMIGNIEGIGCIGGQIQQMLVQENAEYVDVLNFGIDEIVFKSLGFEVLDIGGETIIPNFFEPFEKSNVEIFGGLDADNEGYVIFKGDGDQDRPNIL